MSALRRKRAGGAWLLFWLVFFIGIALLFTVNRERIKETLKEAKVLEALFKNSEDGSEEDPAQALERHIQDLANAMETEDQAVLPDTPTQSVNTSVSLSQAETIRNEPNNSQGTENTTTGNTVERSVYLMRIDTTGTILWTSVKRELPASNSPLRDTLEALVKGPSAAEERQGLISLIPKNVKIQNAVVRGNTAYISLSEDFLFNTYGVEGYAGQRRQIVLTATEFSNVRDVQILIDGKRIDYLGEGIWIGSPVSRNML